MKMPKALSPIIKIAKYTLTDEVRQRSFVVMFVMCVVFVFSFAVVIKEITW